MKLKKMFSFTKPSVRKIRLKSGIIKTVAVKGHVNKLHRSQKRK